MKLRTVWTLTDHIKTNVKILCKNYSNSQIITDVNTKGSKIWDYSMSFKG